MRTAIGKKETPLVTDPLIKLKMIFGATLLLAPLVVMVIYPMDARVFEAFGLRFTIPWWLIATLYPLAIIPLFRGERGFLGYLKVLFAFHFRDRYKDGLNNGQYMMFKKRLNHLENLRIAYYEQSLIKEILEYNGYTDLKTKLTGKHKNKLRVKAHHQFDDDKSKNRRMSSFKNKTKHFT